MQLRALAPHLVGLALLVLPVSGQSVFYTMTPPAVSGPQLDSEVFSDVASVAVASSGEIHRWAGLPATPSHFTIPLPGDLAMAAGGTDSQWSRLSDSMAAYRSVGLDLAAGTADDRLVLVSGLPHNPTVVSTSITGIGDAWTPVNDGVAVQVDAAAMVLRVLRFDAIGATLQVVPAPIGFAGRWGRITDDAFMTLGPGSDLALGTADDEVVVLHGLTPGSAATVSTFGMPPGTFPQTLPPPFYGFSPFAVSESGVGCCARLVSPTDVLLTFVRYQPAGVTYDTLTVSTLNPFPCPQPTGGVVAGIGDTVLAYTDEYIGPGQAFSLVADVSGSPFKIRAWLDDWNQGCIAVQVAEDEIASYCAFGLNGFTYEKLFSGGSVSLTITMPSPSGGDVAFHKPRGDALLALANDPGGGSYAFAIDHLWGANDLSVLNVPEYVPQPRVSRAGPGMACWFGASDLWMVTLPTAQIVGPGVAAGSASSASLSASPPKPVPGTPENLLVTWPPTWNASAVMAVSATRAEPALALPSPFASGTLLQLGLDGLASQLLPLPGSPGMGQLSIDPWSSPGLVDFLTGRPFYFQAAIWDGIGTYHLSPALMTIFR